MSAGRFALDTRIATVALAAILALVSMPIVCGWVLTRCAITADVCHPLQSIDVSSAPLLAVVPQVFSVSNTSRDARVAVDDRYRVMAGRLREAPDLPPPKFRA